MGLPYATPDLPGTPALCKAIPEDFRVDELPAYLPCGEGEHLFLHVEKRGRNTREVVAEIARALRVKERDVGVAGQKDRHAVTTQWISVQGVDVERAAGLSGDGYRVLETGLHRNKLRTGHLRGNRFSIRLRGVDEAGASRVAAIASALEERGLPNFYGPQRFGRAGDNAEVGKMILRGESDPRVVRALRDPRMRRFMVSAFQSEIFNRVLAARLSDGSWSTPLEGDVLQKLASGGLFVCDDPGADLARVGSFECSVTGPLPGPKMHPAPGGKPAELEARILEEAEVSPAQLAGNRDTQGTRRALRLPVRIETAPDDEGILLRFELPAGAYATTVIREITKGDLPPELDAS